VLSVAGLGPEEVESQTLVVDAFRVPARFVVTDRQDLPAEVTHPCRGGFDVVDAEIEADLRGSGPGVDAGRRRDRRDVERAGLVAGLEVPAEEVGEEASGAFAVGNQQREIADVAVAPPVDVFDGKVVGLDRRLYEPAVPERIVPPRAP
jgi:hypothetical protein